MLFQNYLETLSKIMTIILNVYINPWIATQTFANRGLKGMLTGAYTSIYIYCAIKFSLLLKSYSMFISQLRSSSIIKVFVKVNASLMCTQTVQHAKDCSTHNVTLTNM